MAQAKRSVLVACISLVFAGQAAAVEDLTGTYDVGIACKALDSGVRGKLKETSEIELLDDGSGIVFINWPGFFEFRTFLVPEGAKPERGGLAGVNCPLALDTLDGVTIAADVKTKVGSDAASLKGTLIVQHVLDAAIFTCKIKGKRVSTTISKFAICPP
jgi:hypothetical protein